MCLIETSETIISKILGRFMGSMLCFFKNCIRSIGRLDMRAVMVKLGKELICSGNLSTHEQQQQGEKRNSRIKIQA